MKKTDKMWAYLIHIGYNMWLPKDTNVRLLGNGYAEDYCTASDTLRFDKDVWDLVTGNMPEAGINTLVIDLGEGVQYDSHPEIAVEGSLSKNELSDMLSDLREKGITPIPKLNFSTCHDEWLGVHSQYISTDKYYEVCKNLIEEVIELFDNPPFFHLGMDEETYGHQTKHKIAVIRNSQLWWHDLFFFAKAVTDAGVRPWVWSDRIWNHEDEFLKNMPKEFLQSNWYYDASFLREQTYVGAYNLLDENGYEHVPTGSNWGAQWNFEGTVNYCYETCNQDQIKGFLMSVWRPTLRDLKYRHLEAVDIVRKVRNDLISK